jgi:hypothetical protein
MGEPTPQPWNIGPLRPERDGKSWVFYEASRGPEMARDISALPLLLAHAECSEAQDRYDHEIGYTRDERDAVFARHGLALPESRWHAIDQLARVRAEGLAMARGDEEMAITETNV